MQKRQLCALGAITLFLCAVPLPLASAAPKAQAEERAACDPLDEAKCLFPFPNDFFTIEDESTDTGRLVNFAVDAMPKNAGGVAVDPTEWNRNDGFSPGSPVLTLVPGLDLERTGAAPSTDIARSLREDAPIVLLDADTGKRLPYWAELDASVSSDDLRSLIVRPAIEFPEGHRIVVALRDLKDARGKAIPPGELFALYRDDNALPNAAAESRKEHMNDVFDVLEEHDVKRDDLYLAWDFTVAGERNLSERMLHIRDDAFEALGDAAPEFTVTQVEDDVGDARVARRVTGTFTVPSYLTGDGSPGSRFNNGSDGLPERNGDITANFICVVPRSALTADGGVKPGLPVVYGHGLLGSADEVNAENIRRMIDEYGHTYCATNWIGMATEDIKNAVSLLQDFSRFPTLADRVQQGILDTLFLARLLVHEDGLRSDPAFQNAEGDTVFDGDEAVYDSNSQGSIIGGAATAVAQDWKQAVLGVPGMNYSTLLQRSRDFDTYKAVLDPAYPDQIDRTLGIALVQMLWDRAETNGYAQHITRDPYPDTPRHHVLLHEAFGDHQVANVTAEVEARTIGARTDRPVIAKGRSKDRVPLWGIATIRKFPFTGSAVILWDSGTPAPPAVNLPPREGEDPHEFPRMAKAARRQKAAFLRPGGKIIDACGRRPCTAEPVP
jgi:hypothetical protein